MCPQVHHILILKWPVSDKDVQGMVRNSTEKVRCVCPEAHQYGPVSFTMRVGKMAQK
jgi:hypothetical protein